MDIWLCVYQLRALFSVCSVRPIIIRVEKVGNVITVNKTTIHLLGNTFDKLIDPNHFTTQCLYMQQIHSSRQFQPPVTHIHHPNIRMIGFFSPLSPFRFDSNSFFVLFFSRFSIVDCRFYWKQTDFLPFFFFSPKYHAISTNQIIRKKRRI